MLNLARSDVRDYVEGFLDKLLSENDIAFLKWDYNRNWSEPGWDQVPVDEQQRVYVEYIRNLYAILAICGRSIRTWRSNPVRAEVGASIWAFCTTRMRCGPRTIPILSTGYRCRMASVMRTRHRS